MSIVVNVLTSDFSWIMCDGLAREKSSDRIVSKNQKKFELVNSLVCVGYTGCLEHAKACLELLSKISPEIQRLHSDEIAQLLARIVSQNPHMKAQFLITGKNQSEMMATYTIKNSGALESFIPVAGGIMYAFLCSEHCTISLEPYLTVQQATHGFLSPELIQGAMRLFVEDLAKIDPSVNANTEFLGLSLRSM